MTFQVESTVVEGAYNVIDDSQRNQWGLSMCVIGGQPLEIAQNVAQSLNMGYAPFSWIDDLGDDPEIDDPEEDEDHEEVWVNLEWDYE